MGVQVIIPLNHRDHWTLAVADMKAGKLHHWDSYPTESHTANLGKLSEVFNDLFPAHEWAWVYEAPPTQENSYVPHQKLVQKHAFTSSDLLLCSSGLLTKSGLMVCLYGQL